VRPYPGHSCFRVLFTIGVRPSLDDPAAAATPSSPAAHPPRPPPSPSGNAGGGWVACSGRRLFPCYNSVCAGSARGSICAAPLPLCSHLIAFDAGPTQYGPTSSVSGNRTAVRSCATPPPLPIHPAHIHPRHPQHHYRTPHPARAGSGQLGGQKESRVLSKRSRGFSPRAKEPAVAAKRSGATRDAQRGALGGAEVSRSHQERERRAQQGAPYQGHP
jgi:hypothetical protein